MLSEKKQSEAVNVLRGESRGVLLSGVALNWFGAAKEDVPDGVELGWRSGCDVYAAATIAFSSV
jgi:hypothetical protein